jgi:hypothetical protein
MHTVNYLRHLHSVIHLGNLWPKNEGKIYNKRHAISLTFTKRHFMKFYIVLTVHLVMILDKRPTWRTFLFYVIISNPYMFRATSCSSSGESIVSIQHLVYVTLCRLRFRVQVVPTWTRYRTIWYDTVLIQLILPMMSTRLLETRRELK